MSTEVPARGRRGAHDGRTELPGHGAHDGSPPRVPDFFIVGHAKCGTTALYEMLRGAPADLHAGAQGAGLLRHRPAQPLPAVGGRRRCRRRSRSTSRCSSTPREEQRVGEASSGYLPSVEAPRQHRARAPGRADRRDPARARELPALAAHATAAGPHRDREETCAGRSRSSRCGGRASASRGARRGRRR